MTMPHRHILGMRVDSGTYATASEQICDWAQNNEARYVCVANVHMTMETVDSAEFKQVVNSADMVTSDGMPLVWMLRRLGLQESERVYGPELVLRVCQRAEDLNLPIGLFGGTDDSLERFTAFLAERFPKLEVVYRHAPPFRPLTEEEDAAVVAEMARSGARILFVGIGCPKQERFMHAHKDSIQAVQIGVGAAFDFHSGAVKQAPAWMGRSGLEWLFRLAMEPGRLWRRYAIHNPRFMARATWQLLSNRGSSLSTVAALLFVMLAFLWAGFVIPAHSDGQGSPLSDEPATVEPMPGAVAERAFRTLYVDQDHPRASDANPGSLNRPFRTINAALSSDMLLPGDTIEVAGGIYREALSPKQGGSAPDRRLVIRARGGEEVIISGADPIGMPEHTGGTRWVVNNYSPLDYYGDGTRYQRELVIADGTVLRPVFSEADMTTGTFFVDRFPNGRGRILLDTGSSEAPSLEIARRGSLFKAGNPWSECGRPGQPSAFHLIGLSFRHAANAAQSGAVCLGGSGSLLESVSVDWTVGTGIKVMGSNHRLVHVRANHNGQAGINGTCQGCTLIDSETSFNNFVGHDVFWEAGGGKWSYSSDLQFIRHRAIGNDGPGLWFDGDNTGVTVSYSLFEGNLAAGVFIELDSWDVTVERVTVRGTRRQGWTGAGILMQATGGATLQSNLLSGNEGAGIWLRRDDRARSGHNTIAGNVFKGNVIVPGQDRADLQVDAWTHIELCTNRIVDNTLEDGGHFRYTVDETGNVFQGEDPSRFTCLIDYSDG